MSRYLMLLSMGLLALLLSSTSAAAACCNGGCNPCSAACCGAGGCACACGGTCVMVGSDGSITCRPPCYSEGWDGSLGGAQFLGITEQILNEGQRFLVDAVLLKHPMPALSNLHSRGDRLAGLAHGLGAQVRTIGTDVILIASHDDAKPSLPLPDGAECTPGDVTTGVDNVAVSQWLALLSATGTPVLVDPSLPELSTKLTVHTGGSLGDVLASGLAPVGLTAEKVDGLWRVVRLRTTARNTGDPLTEAGR